MVINPAVKVRETQRGYLKLGPIVEAAQIRKALVEYSQGGKRFTIFPIGYAYQWYLKGYGPELDHERSALYRGYVQVDPRQIPEALRIITEVAIEREKEGKPTNFKFLLAKETFKQYVSAELAISPTIHFGQYTDLNPSDPIIVFYFVSKQKLLELLDTLSQRDDWKKLELVRSHKNRREGSSSFTNSQGVEFRTLCYNEAPGHSLYDKNWRNKVNGTATEFLPAVAVLDRGKDA